MILSIAYLIIGVVMVFSSATAKNRTRRVISALIAFLSIGFTCYRFANNKHDIVVPEFLSVANWGQTVSRASEFGFGEWLVFLMALLLTLISCIQFKKYMNKD